MNVPLFYYLFGYHRVQTDAQYETRLENLLFVHRIVFAKDKSGQRIIPHKERARLLHAAKKERLSVHLGKIRGLPAVLYGYRYRIGVPVGALMAALILCLGTNTVWRVEISGVETLSHEQIEENLATLGFGIGSATAGKNFEELSVSYRLLHPEVAWMGIYTEGTTAHVRIIENKRQTDSMQQSGPANLIATSDAVILHTDILHGTPCVRAGDVVKAGDMLALGIVKGAHSDTLLRAEGSVIGRVSASFSVPISTVQTVKMEKNRTKIAVSVNFFEKVINIFKKNTKNDSDYVIINRNQKIVLPGGHTLPVSISYREAIIYTEKEVPLDEGEALRLATEEMDAQIRGAIGDGELLSRTIRIESQNGERMLCATVEYTKNIAEARSFTAP